MNGNGSADIRISSDPQQAWQLLHDLAYDEDVYRALSNHDDVAATLERYGVYVSDDAIPPEPTLPPVEDLRKGLEELEEAIRTESVAPFAGFRPPWCPVARAEFIPWYIITFGYIFGVAASIAKPPGYDGS